MIPKFDFSYWYAFNDKIDIDVKAGRFVLKWDWGRRAFIGHSSPEFVQSLEAEIREVLAFII